MTLAYPALLTFWMSNSSKKLAVIGLGNTLRRDDGIGIIILESLLNSFRREGADYLNFGIASFDLVHRLGEYEIVLLIDGIDAGLPPGELKVFELKDIAYVSKEAPASTHEFDLKSLFELYKRFELRSKIYVAGIQVRGCFFFFQFLNPLYNYYFFNTN